MTFDKDDPLSEETAAGTEDFAKVTSGCCGADCQCTRSSSNRNNSSNSGSVPALEQLVDACCCITLEDEGFEGVEDHKREFSEPLTPTKFILFVHQSHCEENLEFLIEIYKYEYIWNQLFKRRSSILKCKTKPSSQAHIHEHHDDHIHNKVNNNASTTSEELLLASLDISGNKVASLATLDDACLCKDNEIKEDADPQTSEHLIKQWSSIIDQYIEDNSPYQINLPSFIYKNILTESNNGEILYHSPEILIALKKFVLQLLRENVYEEFLAKNSVVADNGSSSGVGVQDQFDSYTKMSELRAAASSTSMRSSSSAHDLSDFDSLIAPTVKGHSSTASSIKSGLPEGIKPLVRGHTVLTYGGGFPQREKNSESKSSTRGPCNVRTLDGDPHLPLNEPVHSKTMDHLKQPLHHHNHHFHLKKFNGGVKHLLHKLRSHSGDDSSIPSNDGVNGATSSENLSPSSTLTANSEYSVSTQGAQSVTSLASGSLLHPKKKWVHKLLKH